MLVENGCLNMMDVQFILTLKITVFWDVKLCSPVDQYQRFGEICAAGKQSFLLVSFLSYFFAQIIVHKSAKRWQPALIQSHCSTRTYLYRREMHPHHQI
jgi:hypothetical protein